MRAVLQRVRYASVECEGKTVSEIGKGFMVLLGVLNGVCFYMASLLASRMNAAAQFTIVTCASILLSVAVGIIFQGDKLTKKSVISMIFCAIAVLCQYSGIA